MLVNLLPLFSNKPLHLYIYPQPRPRTEPPGEQPEPKQPKRDREEMEEAGPDPGWEHSWELFGGKNICWASSPVIYALHFRQIFPDVRLNFEDCYHS